MTKKNLWYELKALWPDTYSDTAFLLLYTLLGGLAPLYLAWGVKAYRTASLPNVTEFAHAGEFALYSAAMVAPALYLLAQDRKRKPFPARVALILASIVLMLLAVGSYLLVAPEVLAGTVPQNSVIRVYSWSTIWLFGAATVFFYVISILDATRPIQDIRKIDDSQVDDMTRRVNELPT